MGIKGNLRGNVLGLPSFLSADAGTRLLRIYGGPEISANRYALNIYFTTQDTGQRPKLIESAVDFELTTFCNL